MLDPNAPAVQRVREASRGLVRELGFMEDTLAGTGLSASAVFAIIELGSRGSMTARDLAIALRLEKSTVSRLLKALVKKGYVIERRDPDDARRKRLHLTERGLSAFAEITRSASERVASALAALSEREVKCVVDGLEAYSEALRLTARPKGVERAPDSVDVRRRGAPG
ncbi:MAG: MarR family transcriptional regulator [Alphaproteobacteria bacterium]|nr:MarR family transcriptional regulator [Alphaproteobacteria bacterium]